MTHIFRDNGNMQAITAIEAGPCTVTQIKSSEREGYNAIQLGFSTSNRLNLPQKGHLQGKGLFRYLREFSIDDVTSIQEGQQVGVDLFNEGELVNVTGISKGKGFAGTVKRYHFAGGPKTHGQSDRHRAPGSIGATTSPGRVLKGTRMSGHMGNERVTVKNLEVVRVDTERNLLLIKGAVPCGKNGLLLINKSYKKK